MKCISLFSGAGGLDLGLKSLGIEVLASIEADADCCETLRTNGFGGVRECRIEDLRPRKLRRELELRPGDLDLLVGGPPCQPFSKSAFWAAAAAQGLDDPRAATLTHFCSYVEEFKPRAILLENVEGFSGAGGLAYVTERLSKVRVGRRRYRLSWKVVDASAHGVPQRRRRGFLIAVLGDTDFEFPTATHGEGLERPRSAWEACQLATAKYEEDLRIKGRWAELVPSIPEGANYLWHTPKGGGEPLFGWRTRYWSFLLKLGKRQPAPTLVASPSQNSGPFHWTSRLLSTAELAAIQTFPQSYRFVGDRVSRHRQIGNAVPPLLAQVLVRKIIEYLGADVSVTQDFSVERRNRIPASTKPKPVPLKYLALRGSHAAHPGTGKGPNPRLAVELEPQRENDLLDSIKRVA